MIKHDRVAFRDHDWGCFSIMVLIVMHFLKIPGIEWSIILRENGGMCTSTILSLEDNGTSSTMLIVIVVHIQGGHSVVVLCQHVSVVGWSSSYDTIFIVAIVARVIITEPILHIFATSPRRHPVIPIRVHIPRLRCFIAQAECLWFSREGWLIPEIATIIRRHRTFENIMISQWLIKLNQISYECRLSLLKGNELVCDVLLYGLVDIH